MDKRQQILDYFFVFKPKLPIKSSLVAILILVIGIAYDYNIKLILLSLIVMAIIFFNYNKKKKRFEARPSDAQIDEWLATSFKTFRSIGMKKIGYDEDEVIGEELLISGPVLWETKGIDESERAWRVGDDGYTRFSIYDIALFYVTEKGLGVYKATYNFIRDVTVNDTGEEYYYKHITKVSTREVSSNRTLPDGQKLVNSETFSLSISGNVEVEIVLTDPAILQLTQGKIKTGDVEKTIQTIKRLVREKQ